MSNHIFVQIQCPEISKFPLVQHAIDLDKRNEHGDIVITVDREFLKTLGEMADWPDA
jgi:hypothetical protein